MGPTSWGGPIQWSLLFLLTGLISGSMRVRREAGGGSQSLLTVEWEGIQTGDHPDSDVQGFLVEYRAENDNQWNVHSGIIPYKGPNHQYRVQIPRLPMGVSFFVRIKVLGTDGSVLVETPEIRARNEMVSITCKPDDVSEPRNVEITQASRFSLAFRWDVPECGSIGDYQVEVAGLGNASFDIHRQTVIQPFASITNLLPGIVYAIKVRASDRSRNSGPWSSEILEAQTKGDAVPSSDAIHVDYRTDAQLRITWLHYDDERLQHYEVMAVELDADSRRVERARISPQQSSHVLSGLKPNTRYLIGVVAFVDHEPKQSYSITAQTAQTGAAVWSDKPQVVEEADGVATVHWTVPPVTSTPITRFIVEYRLPSENQWQRGDERAFDGSVGDYSVSLSDLVDVPFYAVRIVAVDESNQAVAITDELTVGHAAEGACIGRAGAPRNVKMVAIGGEAARFEWDKPNCDEAVAPVDGYEYLIWESSQAAPPDGASYVGATSIVVESLQPNTRYSFKVRSRSGNGHSSWTTPIEVTTAANGPLEQADRYSSSPKKGIEIDQPRIEQQGSRSTIYWTVDGQTDKISSYQAEIRSHSEQWRASGVPVENDPSQKHFRQQLGALSSSLYYVRVRAIDSNGRTVATSPSNSFQIQCQTPLIPENVRLDRVSDKLVRISWTAPQEDTSCGGVFYITGTVDGQTVNYRVSSSERHFDIQANPSSIHLEVRASNKAGSGSTSQQVILSNARQSLVSTPRVSTRGNDLHVTWRSEGEGRGVFGYRVQFRTDQSGWNPYGQIVPYTGDNQEYQQTLTGLQLGHTYYIHIQVLDRNSYVMYTSAESSATSECKAPSHPPSHLSVSAPDASHVRISWAHPPQSTWGCADLQFELQAEEPHGQAPVSVAGGQTTHIFQSRPNEKWSVKIRARNSAGHSAWTPLSSVRTPAAGELLIGPNVQYRQGTPIVSWQSKEGIDGSTISSYSVEYKSDREENWRQHNTPIPFSGNQRGYQVELSGLSKGQSYQCRVVAKGPRGEIAFTSPIVALHTSKACQKPRRAPSGLQVQPVGPTQIKLTWTALPEQEWNCDRVWYIVKYSTPRNQGFKNLTQGENSVLFESDPYTQWSFEVQAANPAGESEWSRTEVAQTQAAAPGPVSDLRIQPLGADSVQVSWRPPANPNGQISSYEITYQLTNRGMCEEIREAPRTEQTQQPYFVLKNLHPHSRYRIGVAARTTIAGERVSQEVSTEQSIPTAAPNYLRAEDSRQDSTVISWQAPTCLQTNGDITEYEYEVTPADRRTNVQKTTNNVRGTRAQITNLQSNTRYNAKVRAYTARGAGPWSTEVAFQTTGHSIVQAPPHISVIDAGADNAHILWQSPQSPSDNRVDQYKCKYKPARTQEPPKETQFPAYSPCDPNLLRRQHLPPTPPGSQYQCGRIENLQPEKSYEFQVSACARKTCSDYTKPATARISEGPVKVISVVKTGSTDRSLSIRWEVNPEDVPRVTGFRLYVEPIDRSDRPMTFTVDSRTFSYRIDTLKPRTAYNVSVQACTERECCVGTSATMSTDAAQLQALSVAPRIIAEEATSITIEWNSNSREASGYIVEYRLENGAWQQHPRRVPANPAQTTYTATVDGLPTNSVVDLRVRVVSSQNEQTAPSPEVRGRTKCQPPSSPPQGVRLDAPSTNEVRVNWARPARDQWQCDHLNIEISYRVGGGQERTVVVPGDQTEYKFPAEPNQRWLIKLRATNQVGASGWSPEQSITTRQGTPGSVRDLRVKALSPNEVHVQWLPPLVQRGTIVGYDISYRLKHRLACPEEEPRDVSRDFVTIYNHKDLDYTLTGLLPYSLYEVKVRARTTDLGPEETKEVSTEQQPPSAPPLNLELTYALERSLSFQWEPVDCSQRHGHITNYEYEIIGQDDWAKLERQIANTSDTKITIDGLTPFTKYVMRVKAYNSIGGGPNTENLDVMTAKADAPLPPQDLVVAQEGTDFFMVSWLPPYPPYGPHDAYKIRHQLLGTDGWETIEHPIRSPLLQCPAESPRFCFNVTDKEPGQQYRVQVTCRIEGGNYGPWSSVVIANTLQVLPDAPRAIHLIEKTDHSLHIRWIPPVDTKGHITQYRVSIVSLDDPNDKKRTFLVDHPTLTYLFDQLQPETNYNISIAAGTKRGFGPEIYTRYATDLFNIPTVIGAPIVTPDGANALDVQWNGVQDSKNRVKGYIIEIRNAETPAWTEIGGQTDHDSVKRTYLKKVTGLDPDTLYFVRIKVVDKQQRVSNASPEGQGRTGCAAPSSPPTNVAISSPSNKQVRFSWQAPLKGSWQCSSIRYRIEYMNGTNGRQELEVPFSAIEHMFDSPPNNKWVVRIRAENEAGVSDWSKELEVTTPEGAPGPVTDLTADPEGPTKAVVTWKEPENPNGVITGYTLIYRLKSIGQCGPRSSNPIEKHVRNEEQTLEGLLPDSTYEVHVIAHTSLAGPSSQIVSFTTEEAEPSGEPLNVRIGSVTATRADAMWQQPECEKRHGKITDYEYELEAIDEWAENNTGSSRSERVTFDKLTPYTEYRFRVRALNSQGAGPYSEWVSFTTQPSAPPPPGDLQEEATFPHAIEISFIPPSPPHGLLDQYKIRYTPSGESNYKEIRVPSDRLVCSDANKRDRLCYRISDLEPEQEYDIQVAAHTEGGGWSDWSTSISAKTHEQNIPVLERELEVIETKPTSISLRWEGLSQEQAAHVVGYVLEYKSEDEKASWAEYNGITKHRQRQNDYKVTVKDLEPATNYFFRLKVVGKNDKRGAPGPETKAMTNCGKPEEPPSNIKLTSIDFEHLKITWEPPNEESWLCNEIEYIIDFVNTTNKGQLTVNPDSPSELIIATMPGTKWEVKMRTQTKEEKPQFSRWSDKVTISTQSLPGEIFVTVIAKNPTTAQVDWDLADKDQGWNYGVDITYRLKQLGGCTEAATGSHEPITRLNVQEKQLLLTDLHPGSTYEVIVTPRRPPSLHSSIVAPKTVRTFKTESDVPTGAPQNLQSTVRKDSELGFKWDPPECAHQNGNVSQYEFILSGLDEWNEGDRESVTPRLSAIIDQLQPGSLYRMKVRAYTAKGAGPWSEPLDIRTTGSELGPPRELTAVQTMATQIQLTWLPPYPEKAVVTAYRIRYSPRADDSNPTEAEMRDDQLSCTGYKSPIITSDNLCATIKNLQPSTTYKIAVQGQSASGNWGEWSSDYFSTTRKDDNDTIGGSIKLLSAGHDNIRVQWTPPAVIGNKIEKYDVYISVASELDENPQMFTTSGRQTDYHFRNLDRVTHYNVTVQGHISGAKAWFISGVFATTDFGDGLLSWLPAPTDLHLIEKSDTMLHVDWVPPEVWDPEKRDLITHYRVTIAPVDPRSGIAGTPKNYTVLHPGNSIKFEELSPETIYNITVQGATSSGYGQILWGTYSTLATGQRHILKLQYRTPTTLTLEWDPVWGTNHRGYTLSCFTIASVFNHVKKQEIKTFQVHSTETHYTVKGLNPSTTYNCTLQPKDHAEGAWGAWSTLPPQWFLVKNLKQCDKTDFAVSISWEPIVDNMASHYQVRYLRLKEHDGVWQEEAERESKELLCPKDGCGRHCYLVFNLPHKPDEYVFQVRAQVDGQWNYWKSAGRLVISEPPHIKASCCIVPPPYFVDKIGAPGTFMEIDVAPSPTETNITRYYVVVDERDPPGDTNWTELTDKVTAKKKSLEYYVAASFNLETLPEPRKVRLGDGTVIGGYLNYPLTKGKKYNYEIYTLWNITGAPLVGRLRASPYLVTGWHWWWLLLLLLLLLLLILLCCSLLWCLQRRYRARKDTHRQTINGEDKRLLGRNESEVDRNIRGLQDRIDRMHGQMTSAQGDFEKGYVNGYKDASRLGSASAARRHLTDAHGDKDQGFHEGYAKGLRDAGMTGMTTSMHNLAQKSSGGYSAGFMQGYRDGNSGVFGDRVTPSLISRLDEQYPGQDDFKQGFVDGFKEGCKNRTVQKSSFEDSRRLQQSLTELTERLTSLEKTKGDEIHSTKIYHVYNQQPEFAGYSSTGAQLAHELDEMNSRSRTSTLRRHYTPGDYLKYASEEERYGSLGRNRRSLSASALARESSETRQETRQERQRYASGTLGSSYITRSAADRQGTDTFARRYNYRSRSDVGSPRRYASQTLLDASRPGPSTPHARRDALATLQRELDTLSRSPHGGYASDSAAGYDSVRSKARGYSNYDYDTFHSSSQQEQQQQSSTTTQQMTENEQTSTTAVRYPGSNGTVIQPTVVSTVTHQIQPTTGTNEDAGRWTDDLIGIVNEPMERTLDRMRQFSTSAANVEGGQSSSQAQQGQEVVEEKYHRSYKEEHSSGGAGR